MRARRSKRYRKIMSSYQMSFSFREPYQVLLDSHFLKACHSFHMPLQKYVENTLHGKCNLFVTKCTLAKIMDAHQKQKERKAAGGGEGGKARGPGRPDFLPPPTEVPLRHCKHKNDEGEELGIVSEARCLLDLLAGQPRGNEHAKNKQHYVLATAEAEEREQHGRGFIDVRERARLIPGVPIVYVKRSVMILEELSGVSERAIKKVEREKFGEGLVGLASRKRKRGEGEDDEEEEGERDDEEQNGATAKIRGMRRAKGPNPLSVKKKKNKERVSQPAGGGGPVDAEAEPIRKRPTRRGGRRVAARRDATQQEQETAKEPSAVAEPKG
ncbi:hypothetical protein A1O7_08293 [Cladophialophora yegresii CBS 114405]|uniref:UTP23 sensor motif region domain-containing protein n=1 Tax=Cladophialophora yegresii CBS 114405 TaxID=1182544 RepID=W9VTA2_9EURO|nr:uncharacterized protein A1O7_08293 [Cladophialophora yegresii CBS 114405]EXJ55366.1 hypothetical protein A1O7_08293 [Cladophialophora yegresii CBS 114405]